MIENSPIESCVVSYRDEDGRLVGCVLIHVLRLSCFAGRGKETDAAP